MPEIVRLWRVLLEASPNTRCALEMRMLISLASQLAGFPCLEVLIVDQLLS